MPKINKKSTKKEDDVTQQQQTETPINNQKTMKPVKQMTPEEAYKKIMSMREKRRKYYSDHREDFKKWRQNWLSNLSPEKKEDLKSKQKQWREEIKKLIELGRQKLAEDSERALK